MARLRNTFLAALLLIVSLFVFASCVVPEFPPMNSDSPSDGPIEAAEVAGGEEKLSEEESMEAPATDKQEGITAAAESANQSEAKTVADIAPAAEEDADAATATVAQAEAPAETEAAPPDVNWSTVTSRVEHELAAIGNPDAPLTIIEFSDFM